MTLSLPANHVLTISAGLAPSILWVSLDGGPAVRSLIQDGPQLVCRWLDISAADIPVAWRDTTGETIGHICEGCGRRRIDARVVSGSDEWWCGECR